MANIVQLKRSSVSGRVPDAANVEVGEPVVNLADQIIFTKDGNGNVIVIGSGTTSNVVEGSNLYFTDARVKTAISNQTLDNATFSGAIVAGGELTLWAVGGDEGGQINLGKPITNTSLAGNVAIDIYQNKLRIFEGGGSARGVYVDLTSAGAGVSTNLINSGTGTITSVAGVSSGSVSNAQLATATVTSQTLTNATFSANVTADKFISTNNGNGQNYRVGDDIWLGDVNLADTFRVSGIQNGANAYIIFGNSDTSKLGRASTGPLTYTGDFSATGNISGTWQGSSISTTYTDAKVVSVAGANGTVSNSQLASGITSSGVLTTANVSEVTNLYYTNARAYANVVAAGFYDTVSNTDPIGASESGTTLSISHLNSGVSAATYGNATFIPQYVVNATGHITSASNVVVNVANTNIVGNIIASQITSIANSQITGNIISSQIQPTGVSASTYGGADKVGVFVVDQQGRLTSASNVSISIPSSALNTDVALGSQTSGAYVSNLVAGTGVVLTNLGNEGATPTISIGQAVGTTSDVTFRDVTITGNTYITGNTFFANATTLIVEDALVQYAYGNPGDAFDIGFIGHYNDSGTERHTGLFRDATDKTFKFFANSIIEPTANVVDISAASFQLANVQAGYFIGDASALNNLNASNVSSGTLSSGRLPTSGVAASTYGGAAVQPVLTIDTYGRVTSASNVTSTVANTNITGNIISSQIAATGVTAATYGNATIIPSFVVDQQGRITSASNVAITVSGASFSFSSTPPSSPSPGDRWLDSDSAILYTYVNDGSSSQWVDLGSYTRGLPTSLPITTRSTSTVTVSLSNGYLGILNRTGSQISVLVY